MAMTEGESSLLTPPAPFKGLFDGNIQKVLAVLITTGFFSVIGFMMLFPIPETGHDVLLVLIGALGAAFTGIVAYYFGSSSGSAAKTALAANRV